MWAVAGLGEHARAGAGSGGRRSVSEGSAPQGWLGEGRETSQSGDVYLKDEQKMGRWRTVLAEGTSSACGSAHVPGPPGDGRWWELAA